MRIRSSGRGHPRISRSLRCWAASISVTKLFAAFLLLTSLLASAFSLADHLFARKHGRPPILSAEFASSWLDAWRAVLGIDSLPHEPDNWRQDAVSAAAALVGAVMPAVIIGIVAVRLFSIRAFEWRRTISLAAAVELRSTSINAISGADGMLAIRFYRKQHFVGLIDIQATVYLRYPSKSSIDGTTYFRRQRLQVLDLSGAISDQRHWPMVVTSMPLTIWVPTLSPIAPDGSLHELQGHVLDAGTEHGLHVQVEAKVAGLGISLVERHDYSLDTDIQPGRPVPVEPRLGTPAKTWKGWDRFEEAAELGVFLYGSLMHPQTVAGLLGRNLVEGTDYVRARLTHWTRDWTVSTDNTTSTRVSYHDPDTGDRPAVQVLFLNVEPRPEGTVEGVLVRITMTDLLALDHREANYERTDVTSHVTPHADFDHPDVIWTYTGKNERAVSARQGLVSGTARIRRDYLDTVSEAAALYDTTLSRSVLKTIPRDVPVVVLERRVHPAGPFDDGV